VRKESEKKKRFTQRAQEKDSQAEMPSRITAADSGQKTCERQEGK